MQSVNNRLGRRRAGGRRAVWWVKGIGQAYCMWYTLQNLVVLYAAVKPAANVHRRPKRGLVACRIQGRRF